jgi:hypothetical protein
MHLTYSLSCCDTISIEKDLGHTYFCSLAIAPSPFHIWNDISMTQVNAGAQSDRGTVINRQYVLVSAGFALFLTQSPLLKFNLLSRY